MSLLEKILEKVLKNNLQSSENLEAFPSSAMDTRELGIEAIYKCSFCDVFFRSMQSIEKHNKLFCHKRRKLPRSCTVTSAVMAANSQSPDRNVVFMRDDIYQSNESAVVRPDIEPKTVAEKTTSLKINCKDLTTYLMNDHSYYNKKLSEQGNVPASVAERGRSLDEEESTMDNTIQSSRKHPNAASLSLP